MSANGYLKRLAAYEQAPGARPVFKLRGTITVDVDVADYLEAQCEQTALNDLFAAIKEKFPAATLEFRQRKPRQRRRPAAPRLKIVPYRDE